MPPADRVADWVALVNGCYPEADAAGWDATGLQVGDPEQPVRAVLICLDVTAAVIAEAQANGADLVLAHHPLLFRGLQRLTPATAAGRLALAAASTGVAILAAHTNFDVAVEGTSGPVVDLLDLVDVRPLAGQPAADDAVKLVAFVPVSHTEPVLAALSNAGAGVIGEYDQCSFRLTGTGSFRPSAAANPVTGERGVRNEVSEDRLEMVLPRARLGAVVGALRSAHPYEEVAFDLYPLLAAPGGQGKGLGRVGDLPEPLTLADVAARLAEGLPSPFLRVAGDPGLSIRRVAVCGGAGESLIDAALGSGADCYVTADLRHHPVLDALTMGLSLVDAGHYDTEAPALSALASTLTAAARERGLSARLLLSKVSTRPWVDWRAARTGQA